jgi:Na+-driven multidrug efflux pump
VQTTAAYGACNQLWNYVQMPAVAVGQAVSSMAAQNVGARKWERVDRIAWSGVIFNFLLSGSVIGAIILFSHPLLGLFLLDPNAIAVGQHVNAVVIWSFAFFGVNLVLSGVVRSTGAVVPPLLILFVAMWLIRIPFAYFLLGRLGANAVWYSFPVSALFSLVCAILYYRFGNWKAARMLAAPTPRRPVEA